MAVVANGGTLLSTGPPWWVGAARRTGITYASGFVEDYAAIYRTQPNVRLVVNFLARNIAQLAMAGFLIGDDEDAELSRISRKHDLSRVLRRPNDRTTRHGYMLALAHDLAIFDAFFGLKLRSPGGRIQTVRIPPQHVEPDGGSWLFPDGYELVGIPGRRDKWKADELIAMHGHNPEDARRGLSPIEAIRRILIEDTAASEFRSQFWRRGARISGIIERPATAPKWSDPARARFREDFGDRFSGQGPEAGGTPVLEEGMKWVEAGFSAKDAEYLATRRLSREECAAAWHVSPLFVGILEHANFSNVKEQHRHLYADTLGPSLDSIEEEHELQLVPEFEDLDPDDVELRFNLDEKLRGSFEEEATVLQTATGAPWMLRNEARRRRGLPPVPGGDELVVPLNVLVGGQASPRDSAPPAIGAAGRRRGHRVSRARALPGAPKALPPGPAKAAAAELPADVVGWQAKHEEILGAFFDRQAASVSSKLGAGRPLEEAFDAARWNRELEGDLAALAFTMAEEIGQATADEWGGTFDRSISEAWLLENARIAAEKVNATTLAALEDELDAFAASSTGTASRSAGTKADEDEPEDELDVVDAVFALAVGVRAAELAVTRTTSIGNFARKEGAEQSGAGTKVWVVNSSSSRHPGMNGERVAIGEEFSNGMLWPGDPNGDVDETAGCVCSLAFEP